MFDEFDDKFDESFEKMQEEARKMIELLKKLETLGHINEDIEKQMDDTLGKPDLIQHYTEDGLYFEKRIWHIGTGDIVKIIMSDKPNFVNNIIEQPKTPEIPLQQQLKDAIANENFEEAARIRDLITPPKKKIGRPKKVK